MVGRQTGRPPGPVGAHSPGAGPESGKIGVRHGVLGLCVFLGDKCCQCRKHGTSLSRRHGGALRSQSREAVGPVVRGLEASGAHQGRGAGGLRKIRHAGAVRARGRGRCFQCHGSARGLQRGEPLSHEPLSAGDVDVHRRAFQSPHGLHRDIQNMPGHSNHALALGDYTGGRMWIEDDEGDSTAWLADKKVGRELRGRWLDMHDKPVSFDARRYHMVEPHEGSMWALAAYVPQAYARATEQHRQALREAGFPLPALS